MGEYKEPLPLNTRIALMNLMPGAGLRITSGSARRGTDESGWVHDAFRVKLTWRGRELTTVYRKGTAHMGNPPHVEEVLNAFMVDCQGLDESFEEWCRDYGYDTDSRKAHDLWETCQQQSHKFRKFLNDDNLYDAFIYETEGL